MAAIDVLEIDVAIDTRQIIRDRLAKNPEGRNSIYWLAEQLNGKVARSSIYFFLREKNPKNISSDALAKILEILEIDLIPRRKD